MSLLDKGCQLKYKTDLKQNINETYRCCNSLSRGVYNEICADVSNTKSIDTFNDGNLIRDHRLQTY